MTWPSIAGAGESLLRIGKEFAGSGPLHRRRLADIGIRISVTGIRGKSTAVRWLHEILHGRGYDTYAKVTGVQPLSVFNGVEHPIDRPPKVRLYENERELRRFGNVDAAVFENQGIREYTTRLVNEQFVRPQVIFLTNVREDHLGTLGASRFGVARSLARAVPAGTHVVNGEADPTVRDYLEAELDRRDATIEHVRVPATHEDRPGAELVYGLDPVLEAVGEPTLDPPEREAFLERMDVSWTNLPGGRVFDASAANDTQSTELIRRRLLGDADEVIQPVLYLRGDRRGRTATFCGYIGALADRGAIEQARVVGQDASVFERHADVPVVVHDEASDSAATVLDEALADGWPVVLMTNTVSEFMDGMRAEIRAREREAGAADPGSASEDGELLG